MSNGNDDKKIDTMAPKTGRMLNEDDVAVNIADIIGEADDDPGDNTIIGLLKQIAENTNGNE